MNAITEGRRTHHGRLGLDSLVERHEHVSYRLDNGGVKWQSILLDRLLLDPMMRSNGECVTLRFDTVADCFASWGLSDRSDFFPQHDSDQYSPAAAVAGYAHHLHLCRLVCYSTETLNERAWMFTNGASLRSAMGLPFRGSLHFDD